MITPTINKKGEEQSKVDFTKSLLNMVTIADDTTLNQIHQEQEAEKRKSRSEKFPDMVPKRYRDVIFQGSPRLLEAQRTVLYGPYGTGKTYTGYAIARELFVSGQIQNFRLEREREIYNNILAYQNSPARFRELYYDVELLIIDEFGKNSHSDASASHIFNIIDYRYDWELRTILICNAQSPDELRQIVPEAVQDRFVGSTLLLKGNSQRKPE